MEDLASSRFYAALLRCLQLVLTHEKASLESRVSELLCAQNHMNPSVSGLGCLSAAWLVGGCCGPLLHRLFVLLCSFQQLELVFEYTAAAMYLQGTCHCQPEFLRRFVAYMAAQTSLVGPASCDFDVTQGEFLDCRSLL